VSLHPASLLLAWLAAALALQQLDLLGLALAALLIVPLAAALAPRRSWQMLRRSRWLFVSLVVLFAAGTPGRVLPLMPWLSIEGLELAAEHALRLGLLLLLLALLLQRLALEYLMSGLYLLLAPLAALGFARQRAVARLLLVIDYVQGNHGKTWRQWLGPADADPPPMRLAVTPMRGADYAAVGLLLLGLGSAVFRG